jgi:hypothetical protein
MSLLFSKAQLLIGMLLVLTTSVVPAFADSVVLDQNGARDVANLQQIALALHNYSDAVGHFPAEFTTSGGTPLLSWRVALLPFLGEQALYSQFDKTKAWDDPANLPLLQQMPDIFRTSFDSTSSTFTRYAGGSAAGSMFEGANGVSLSSVTDGSSNTILIGETESSNIPWTAPNDILIGVSPTLGGTGFSSFIPNAVPFAFVDGSVRFLPNSIDSAALRGLFIRNDGIADSSAALSYVVATVPEPGTVILLASGLMVVYRRRRARHL